MPLNSFDRRTFLRVGGLSLFGNLSYGEALAARQAAPAAGAKDLSVILLWCAGAMSQMETWDPKPEADERYRGSFRAIPTSVDGVRLGEHLPLSAKLAGKYTIIRSTTTTDSVHESAQAFFLSGHRPIPGIQYPAVGAVVSRELKPASELPNYIITGDAPAAWEQAAFLGARHNPFAAGSPHVKDYKVRDLDLPMGVDWARMEQRNALRKMADNYFRQFDSARIIDTIDTHYATALSLISSERARRAFDIAAEPEKLRERYGRSAMGQACLLARRLVENGVRFISVRSQGWDHHQEVFKGLSQDKLPEFDRAFSALLEDLDQRGLLDATMVIVGTEFGRTPEINVNAGRDHWVKAFSVVISGAGIAGGRVIGATDRNGWEVTERPVQVEEFLATVYTKLGVDYTKVYPTPINRPVRIIDEPFEPVSELLA